MDKTPKEASELFDTFLRLYDILSKLLAERDLEKARKTLIEKKDNINFDWQKYYEMPYTEFINVYLGGISKELNLTGLDTDSSQEECLKVLNETKEYIFKALTKEQVESLGIDESLVFSWLFLVYVNDVMILCILKYDKQIHELIYEAGNGNQKSFMDLIELDPTIITTEYGKRYLCIASYTQDDSFMKEISKLIKRKKKSVFREEKRRFWAFHILSRLGYESRPYKEWADFLGMHGFDECSDEGLVRNKARLYKVPKLDTKKKKS